MLMPKTAVDEYCLLMQTAGNVRLSWQLLRMKAEAIAKPVN